MGQFKPMVKMMTTEPTVELKLKKGGSVEKKMQMGGTPSVDAPRMPTRGGSASGEAMPGAAPMKPSMAARRRAMKARPGGAAPAAPVGRAAAMMKNGGGVKKMAMGGMGGMPPRDIGTGAGPRRPLVQAIDMPRPRGGPSNPGSMPRPPKPGSSPDLRSIMQSIKTPAPSNTYPSGGTPPPNSRGSSTGPIDAPQSVMNNLRNTIKNYTPDGGGLTPPPMMKKGGKVHEDVAQDRAMIKKAMSGKKFATGGVVMGQSGYKTGGVIKGNGGGYKHGGGVKMYAKGGGVNGNVSTTPPGVSGTTTGSVKKSNGGGYKTGGAAKKFADGGAVQSDGRAVKMPQGNKRPSAPVSISRLSGTFKKGGSVGKYSTGGSAEARSLQEAQEQKRERKEREAYANAPKVASELEEAMNPMSMMKEMAGKVKKLFAGSEMPKGSVTKTEKSVTVAPGKKRGGAC